MSISRTAIPMAVIAALVLVGPVDRPELYSLESVTVFSVVDVVPFVPAQCVGRPLVEISDPQGLFYGAAQAFESRLVLVRESLKLLVENLVENPANAVFTPCPIV